MSRAMKKPTDLVVQPATPTERQTPKPLPHAVLPTSWTTPVSPVDIDFAGTMIGALFDRDPVERKRHQDLHKLLRALHNARVVTETVMAKSVQLLPEVVKKLNTIQITAHLTALFSSLEMLASRELATAAAKVADEHDRMNDRASTVKVRREEKRQEALAVRRQKALQKKQAKNASLPANTNAPDGPPRRRPYDLPSWNPRLQTWA